MFSMADSLICLCTTDTGQRLYRTTELLIVHSDAETRASWVISLLNESIINNCRFNMFLCDWGLACGRRAVVKPCAVDGG